MPSRLFRGIGGVRDVNSDGGPHATQDSQRPPQDQRGCACLQPRQIGAVDVGLFGELRLGQPPLGADPCDRATEISRGANSPLTNRSFGFVSISALLCIWSHLYEYQHKSAF